MLFQCCVCAQKFLTDIKLKRHCYRHLNPKTGRFKCSRCQFETDNRSAFLKHAATHRTECAICNTDFGHTHLLQSHMESQHADRLFTCKICGKKIATKDQLDTHMHYHRFNSTGKQCPICGTIIKSGLNKHIMRKHPKKSETSEPHHSDNQHTCSKCFKKFTSRINLAEHVRRNHTNHSSSCPTCGKTFSKTESLTKHIDKVHLNKDLRTYICELCGKRATSSYNLKVHMRIHSTSKLFFCDLCGQGFNYKAFSRANIKDTGKNVRCSKKFYSCPVCGIKLQNCHLVNHVKNKHTKEDVFICCYCKKPLSNHSMLADHIKFHLGIETKKGKLHCSLCPSVFTSASAFHRHSHTHRTVCVFCNKDFGFLRLLQDHYKKEHWEEMFPCRVCGHRLATKRQHWTHERHHKYSNGDPCHICGKVFVDMKLHLAYHEKSGDNNEADSNTTASLINNGGAVIDSEKHLCTMCPSTFPTEGFLVRHMTTIHKQDMGLKCPQCPKRFGTRKQLASHVKRHVDRKEKKFVCSVCEKIFAENHTLKMHMRVHDLEKFLTCSICDKGFNYKVTYKTHMKTKHG
ncbi:hypothetical protein EGW08_018372, partial [Elysia chlorotica]